MWGQGQLRVWRVWGEVRTHEVGGGLTRGWVDPCMWPDPWVGAVLLMVMVIEILLLSSMLVLTC